MMIARLGIYSLPLLYLAFFILLGGTFSSNTLFAQTEQTDPLSLSIPYDEIDFSNLKRTGSGRVETIIDGLTILLKDKRIIRLASVEIPHFATRDNRVETQSLQFLQQILPQGTEITLYQTRGPKLGRLNRMEHPLAHIVFQETAKDQEVWVQGLLLSRGLARAFPSHHNPEMSKQLYLWESYGRQSNAGLWAKNYHPILTIEETHDNLNQHHVVEGIVQSVASVRNNVYLNFGADWKKDFTIMIPSAIRRAFSKDNIDLRDLQNQSIRVRGWLRSYNGPFLELHHKSHLEILETPLAIKDNNP